MDNYNPKVIELKWQNYFDTKNTFKTKKTTLKNFIA